MAKLTLDNIPSGFASTEALNSNNDKIEAAVENTISRDGSSPNQMEANLDMNSNRILNLPAPTSEGEPLRKGDQFTSAEAQGYAATAEAEATAAAASAVEAAGYASDALAHLNDFEGVYLGVQASDPAVDLNGNPLDGGEFYLNSVSNTVRIYDGSVWQAATADAVNVAYDNATSGLTATDVQAAIDELVSDSTHVGTLNGGPFVSSDVFTASVIGATYESVGPTGSGATNIWTALDSVPSWAEWVEVRIENRLQASTSGSPIKSWSGVYAKSGGSAVITGNYNLISRAAVLCDTTNNNVNETLSTSKIPVNANNIFELSCQNSNVFTSLIYFTLVGYGKNI